MMMTKNANTTAATATLALVVVSIIQSTTGFVSPTGMTRILEMESIKTLDNCILSQRFMSTSDDVSETVLYATMKYNGIVVIAVSTEAIFLLSDANTVFVMFP
jgi:hypothetical protein